MLFKVDQVEIGGLGTEGINKWDSILVNGGWGF